MSLLWPQARDSSPGARLSELAAADLHLDEVVRAVVSGSEAPAGRLAARQRFAHQVLTELLLDTETIVYRQAILADLMKNPGLRADLEQLLPALEALSAGPSGERYRPAVDVGLERVAHRLAELELLVEAVTGLTDALGKAHLQSSGLQSTCATLEQLRTSTEFIALARELPELRARLSSVRSVTLGVNLAADLTPESATILDLQATPVDGRRALLFRLLGGGSESEALTPLQRGEGGAFGRPNELVRDLRRLLSEVVAPVQAALQRFARMSSDALGQIGQELAFWLGVARLIDRLCASGLPVCCPEILNVDERRAELIDMYDVGMALALSAGPTGGRLVTNAARFDAHTGRVWVLTGPNRGGKTTYTRAVGLAHVFLQTGLHVPARAARMSPVDAIYSHFPSREEVSPGRGRLDVEAERLASIFREATPRSLILLNEALSGTSALEALDLARGLVRALRLLGARAIYVTHLHELAFETEEINATTAGDGTVASLLADSSAEERRTYRIVPGPPSGVSFAAEIAEQHGISFAQLAKLLQERGVA